MIDPIKAHERMLAASDDVKSFAGCDASRCFVAMLEATIDSYRTELEHISKDALEAAQAKIAQCRALLAVVAGDTNASPKT